MQVDLLVVNYNTRLHLQRLIRVLTSDYESGVWNLYVQDNGSTDDSKQWLFDYATELGIKKVEFANNVGYAKAINHLASISNSEILAACNADIWFTTNHVKQVIKSFEDNPNQAIMGPKQMDEESRIRHGGIIWDGRNGSRVYHREWSTKDPQDRVLKTRDKVWTVSGSIYYVRRLVWDDLTNYPAYQKHFPLVEGAFWPTPHFFEETGCSQLANYLGYEVWYDGTIETAGHAWHASTPVGDASRNYFDTSKQIYIKACDALGIEHEC